MTFPVFLQFSIVPPSNVATIPPAISLLSRFSVILFNSPVFFEAMTSPVEEPIVPPTFFPEIFPLFVQLVIVPFSFSATIPAVYLL